MNTELACLPCLYRQVERTLSYAGVNGERGRMIIRQAGEIIDGASLAQAPVRISTRLHRLIREETGKDPYEGVKRSYNRIALDMLPEVRRLASCGDSAAQPDVRLAGCVRAAIAGNIIDFGIYEQIDLDRSLRESFLSQLPIHVLQKFSAAVDRARSILYLCDNAGEIVFDRVLIEDLRARGKEVTAVVKGGPVINDATMEDARSVGLHSSAKQIIDNGNDGIGTMLEQCSDLFLERYQSADLIISKGQANFETLVSEKDERTYFLFRVKCQVVAELLGKREGDIVLMGPAEPPDA